MFSPVISTCTTRFSGAISKPIVSNSTVASVEIPLLPAASKASTTIVLEPDTNVTGISNFAFGVTDLDSPLRTRLTADIGNDVLSLIVARTVI